MPTEDDHSEVIKKGIVKMNLFATLNLENIQIRLLSAKRVFSCYLSGQQFNIEKLDL